MFWGVEPETWWSLDHWGWWKREERFPNYEQNRCRGIISSSASAPYLLTPLHPQTCTQVDAYLLLFKPETAHLSFGELESLQRKPTRHYMKSLNGKKINLYFNENHSVSPSMSSAFAVYLLIGSCILDETIRQTLNIKYKSIGIWKWIKKFHFLEEIRVWWGEEEIWANLPKHRKPLTCSEVQERWKGKVAYKEHRLSGRVQNNRACLRPWQENGFLAVPQKKKE